MPSAPALVKLKFKEELVRDQGGAGARGKNAGKKNVGGKIPADTIRERLKVG